MKGSTRTKRGRAVPCSICGVGTHMGSEICVKCAERLLEQPYRVTQASGDVPMPHVDEDVVAQYVQMDFWARWE